MARIGHSLAGHSHDPDFTPSALNSPFPHYTTATHCHRPQPCPQAINTGFALPTSL